MEFMLGIIICSCFFVLVCSLRDVSLFIKGRGEKLIVLDAVSDTKIF